jgi:hypothetical protein
MSAVGAPAAATSRCSDAQTAKIVTMQDFSDPIVTFNFWGRVMGTDYPSLSPAQQDDFKTHFAGELASLKTWWAQEQWSPSLPPADLKIFVSDEYKISKSLLPAAIGQKGRMEFPAWKAVAGESAVAHELVHVYFPNGNRFLAEGLAVYLQAKIGGNPAFPNFGRPLHQLVRELLPKMVPEFTGANPKGLEKIHLMDLDKIATPSSLRLRVGLNLYQDDPTGQAHIYPIAGSFIQFLIETHGMERFRTLFMRTPLKPLEREAGSPDRWREVYGASLAELEGSWKSQLVEGLAVA